MEAVLSRGYRHPARWAAIAGAVLTAACRADLLVEPTVERLEITAPRLALAVDDSLQLSATAYRAGDRQFPPGKVAFGWTSGSPAVAAVNASTGLVIGLAPGRAVIRASARDRRDSATVTVVAAAP